MNDKSPESEEQRPDDANDAPGRFISDDTVSRERADPKMARKRRVRIRKRKETPHRDQSGANRPLVARNQLKPIIPRLFMTMAATAGLEPGVESSKQIFQAVPVKKSAGVEENDCPNSC